MSCSVVVATAGRRPSQLAALRRALDAQAEPPGGFEVVIVEDVERRGPSSARNEGVARACGELIAFTDDDCEPDPGWLLALVARWRGRGAVGVGGTVMNGLRRNRLAVASQFVHDAAHAWANRGAQPRFFSSNNLALPRAALLDVGGFDESLRFAEDRELCDRWIARGLTLEHEPRAIVHHAHRMRAGGFLAQHVGYGRGAWRLRVAQAQSGRAPAPIEPAFYDRLFRDAARSSAGTAALVVAAQLANAAGFATAALADRGGWRGGHVADEPGPALRDILPRP
jgi:GT2 family glycosyltransferase